MEEEQKPHNAKVLNRELLRLETSLKAAGEKPIFCFLHYPPLYQGYQCPEILSLLETYKVELCCYGHLHGAVAHHDAAVVFGGVKCGKRNRPRGDPEAVLFRGKGSPFGGAGAKRLRGQGYCKKSTGTAIVSL